MRILFEEYQYNTDDLKGLMSERYYFPVNSLKSKINFVGYFFNPTLDENRGDIILIFPKVFLDVQSLAFGSVSPELLINPTEELLETLRAEGKAEIIFEISTWLYQAIQRFNKRQINNTISENQYINEVVTNISDTDNTELDIILSLINFFNLNKEFLAFIAKTSHSEQHKINWHKTINKNIPIIQKGKPIYLNFSTSAKRINEDEELIIIFHSVMNFIKQKYSFDFNIPQNYELITNHNFFSLQRKGCRTLKQIKYKYFSDKMLKLWHLLYVYFERSEQIKSKKQSEEILLVKDFNIVFEDMIDDLISDTNMLNELKNHSDGKQVDHIYRYESLFDKDIYFIGDSKYYQAKTSIGAYSKAKQFTYAKNVIQFNIDLFNQGKSEPNIRYRDEYTEGYNITPNFFISAFVNKDFNFNNHYLQPTTLPIEQKHYQNRLFDRDTLFVQNYQINFLFVLSSYLSNNFSQKNQFKKNTRKIFREKLIVYLNEKYDFYKITPDSPDFLDEYFKLLNGKIYKPNELSDYYILALEKIYHEENLELMATIKDNLSMISSYSF